MSIQTLWNKTVFRIFNDPAGDKAYKEKIAADRAARLKEIDAFTKLLDNVNKRKPGVLPDDFLAMTTWLNGRIQYMRDHAELTEEDLVRS